MTISDFPKDMERLLPLVDAGDIGREQFIEAGQSAASRNLEPEWVLRHEYQIPRRRILQVLSESCGCQWVEYDERLPVPAELLARLDVHVLCAGLWFPLIKDGDTVIVATTDPTDSRMQEEVRSYVPAAGYAFRVALGEDVRNFIQDFVNSVPEHIIGNERTGLAHWRNTMARWRTMLACYRTIYARARTGLSFIRTGVAFMTIGLGLIEFFGLSIMTILDSLLVAAGLLMAADGAVWYWPARMEAGEAEKSTPIL